MIGKLIRILVLLAGVGLLEKPVAAVTYGSYIYPGVVAGSYTELDEWDWYDGASGVYVDSALYFQESLAEEQQLYDYEDGYVYTEEYASDGDGDYQVNGDHWVYYIYWGWLDYAESSAELQQDDGGGGGGGGGCSVGDSSIYDGGAEDPGYYGGKFSAQLVLCPDQDFSGDIVYEQLDNINDSDGHLLYLESDCYDYLGDYLEPEIEDNGTWTVNGGKFYAVGDGGPGDYDFISYDATTIEYYIEQINTGLVGYSSCIIWGADQYMYTQTGIGPDRNYAINPVGITIDPVHGP